MGTALVVSPPWWMRLNGHRARRRFEDRDSRSRTKQDLSDYDIKRVQSSTPENRKQGLTPAQHDPFAAPLRSSFLVNDESAQAPVRW
jgi:hypothetical protein